MSCRIFLIRHGETLWNSEMKLQGHADIPLSLRGLEQAGAVAARLADQSIAAVYSSDLNRAVETARQIAETKNLKVIPLRDLREMNFGQWEGLTFKQINDKFGDTARDWWANPLGTGIPGGEGLADLAARVVAAVKGIVERHGEEQVAVVCHGGPIRCLVAAVLGMDLNNHWKIRQDNAAINIMDFSSWNSGIVSLLNDRSHLSGDMSPPFTVK